MGIIRFAGRNAIRLLVVGGAFAMGVYYGSPTGCPETRSTYAVHNKFEISSLPESERIKISYEIFRDLSPPSQEVALSDMLDYSPRSLTVIGNYASKRGKPVIDAAGRGFAAVAELYKREK